jgi:hypothetical protein
MLLKNTKRSTKVQEICKYSKQKESVVEGPQLESTMYEKPLRIHIVNIDIEDKPKFVNIGDCWNGKTVEKIIDLLCEYHDLFSTTFSKMEGIVGELG